MSPSDGPGAAGPVAGPGTRRLTGLDAQFLAMEDARVQGHVSVLLVTDATTASGEKVDAALLRGLVKQRLGQLPPLRWTLSSAPLGIDYPHLVEVSHLDLRLHVTESALPGAGSDPQLAELVARLITRPLDRTRPLWRLHLVHGLAGNRVAALLTVHHAVVDGASLSDLLTTLLDPSAEVRTLDAGHRMVLEQRRGAPTLVARGADRALRRAVQAVTGWSPLVAHLDHVPALRAVPGVGFIASVARTATGREATPVRTAPRTRFQQPLSAQRSFAFGTVPLSEVKHIARACGATVNDVVLACVSGTLRSWLEERQELPDAPLIAMVPRSTRTDAERGTYGNAASIMFVELPTDEPDPLARIRRVRASMSRAKETDDETPDGLIATVNELVPPAALPAVAGVASWLTANGLIPPAVNLIVSNVPGSPVPLYLAGARVRATIPVSAIMDGVGLNLTVASYENQLHLGMVSDHDQVGDPWGLLATMSAALGELAAACAPLDDGHGHGTHPC